MKYIVFYDTTDGEETLRRMRKLAEISKDYKEEDKKLKSEPAYSYADGSGGFQIFETDNFEYLTELAIFYHGAVNFKIIPIITTKRLVELYEENKQFL